MFETGLQHRCIWHELIQGVSCRLAPFVLKIQLESGFAQVEWNPCLNAVSVAPVFPSALLIPPLPDWSILMSQPSQLLCNPPSLSKNRSSERGSQLNQPRPRDGIQAGRGGSTLSPSSKLQARGSFAGHQSWFLSLRTMRIGPSVWQHRDPESSWRYFRSLLSLQFWKHLLTSGYILSH